MEPQGYSGPGDSAKGPGAHASCRTWLAATGCSTRQSRAGTADTNTSHPEVAVIDPGGQPANVASDRACARGGFATRRSQAVDPSREGRSQACAALPLSVLI